MKLDNFKRRARQNLAIVSNTPFARDTDILLDLCSRG